MTNGYIATSISLFNRSNFSLEITASLYIITVAYLDGHNYYPIMKNFNAIDMYKTLHLLHTMHICAKWNKWILTEFWPLHSFPQPPSTCLWWQCCAWSRRRCPGGRRPCRRRWARPRRTRKSRRSSWTRSCPSAWRGSPWRPWPTPGGEQKKDIMNWNENKNYMKMKAVYYFATSGSLWWYKVSWLGRLFALTTHFWSSVTHSKPSKPLRNQIPYLRGVDPCN